MLIAQLQDAISACEQSLTTHTETTDPETPPTEFKAACQTLGNILQSMGRFQDAATWHARSLSPEPNLAEVYVGLGDVYAHQEQWEQAIAIYERAIVHQSDFADAYRGIARVLTRCGDKAEAIEYWYRVLELQPEAATAEGCCNLGNAFAEQGEIQRALFCYQRSLEHDPSYAATYHNLGELAAAQGNWDIAVGYYRRAIERVKKPGWAYQKWGDALVRLGRLSEATVAYHHAIELDPSLPLAHHNLVETLQALRQWEDSIAVSRATIAQNSNYPWAYTQLGRALMRQGETEEAIAAYQKACELRDWQSCIENQYEFTEDWFSHNIPIWQEQLQSFVDQPHLQFLEIGSFQGMSACWLLDRILTHASARLTCIDPSFQAQFLPNLTKTGALAKVIPLEQGSHTILPTLATDNYDVIYIDGCHLAEHVYQDAILSWRLLKPNGLLIFDDYDWQDPDYPNDDPKLGIDRFLLEKQDEYETMQQGYQVIIKKVIRSEADL